MEVDQEKVRLEAEAEELAEAEMTPDVEARLVREGRGACFVWGTCVWGGTRGGEGERPEARTSLGQHIAWQDEQQVYMTVVL